MRKYFATNCVKVNILLSKFSKIVKTKFSCSISICSLIPKIIFHYIVMALVIHNSVYCLQNICYLLLYPYLVRCKYPWSQLFPLKKSDKFFLICTAMEAFLRMAYNVCLLTDEMTNTCYYRLYQIHVKILIAL